MKIKNILILTLCLFSMQSHSMAQTKLTDLPDEMLLDIILTTIKPLDLIEAAESINSLSLTSQQFQRLAQDKTVRQVLAQKIKDPQKELFDFAQTKEKIGDIAAPIVISELINAGANVNQSNLNGETPLMFAAGKGHKAVVEKLLNAGATVNQPNVGGNTALAYAADKGHKDVVEELLKAGATVNQPNIKGNTVLIYAAGRGDAVGRKDVVEKLLKAGANPNHPNHDGFTALIAAAGNGHKDVVEELLNAGADVAIKDKEDKTAIDWALTPEIRTILEEALVEQQAPKGLKKLKLDDPD